MTKNDIILDVCKSCCNLYRQDLRDQCMIPNFIFGVDHYYLPCCCSVRSRLAGRIVWLLHHRLSHASFGYLRRMLPSLFSGISESNLHCENAFLHGNLEEEVYMDFPPRYDVGSFLSQCKYVLDLLKETDMLGCKPTCRGTNLFGSYSPLLGMIYIYVFYCFLVEQALCFGLDSTCLYSYEYNHSDRIGLRRFVNFAELVALSSGYRTQRPRVFLPRSQLQDREVNNDHCAKPSEFMTIETRSVKKKTIMGKSIDDLPMQGKLKFPEKQMAVDVNPFPSTTIGMVDAHIPKNKRKAEYIPVQHIRKRNGQTRLKIDLFSNAPPTERLGPPIDEPMIGSSSDETHESRVSCDHCKTPVEPGKKTSSTPSTTPTTSPRGLGNGPRRQVFDRLGPQVRPKDQAPVRRRLDFDVPFYNEDYYLRNTSSSGSPADRKTFKPPRALDQRWYSYNSPTGLYMALSKSQKCRRQRIDCMAQRREAQTNPANRWQQKKAVESICERPTPTIMTELIEGRKVAAPDFDTTIEEFEKRIKLLLQPEETRACLEHFRQEAERKLSPLPPHEPFIKIRRNLHPLFLGDSLEYMREFHKKYSANDLYGLPKACQEALDLALTCPDAEQIIQKTSDPAIKARFQHIREARVLGFEVNPYTDIDADELPFSLEDLQYLRYHFEVFSAVSLFGLTVDEEKRIARLDTYLDTRNAHIAYEERARVTQDQNKSSAVKHSRGKQPK
ncbi:beta-glucosidase 24-like [Pyrus ussuriensis x Pyrus communis]|uniref:Beta-glucosidase 24-like n=1 Tax=Pyrus ussuriensis x Pyrus communis TaxID=2448454 RepID=A0A5N5GZN3_9ROSA|nr:beta-glucosidase 24-like [Pyrus ussuriensis x Pyrus communis]